jgi:hypothetical protein
VAPFAGMWRREGAFVDKKIEDFLSICKIIPCAKGKGAALCGYED